MRGPPARTIAPQLERVRKNQAQRHTWSTACDNVLADDGVRNWKIAVAARGPRPVARTGAVRGRPAAARRCCTWPSFGPSSPRAAGRGPPGRRAGDAGRPRRLRRADLPEMENRLNDPVPPGLTGFPRPVLATGKVRYVGEPIAVVVAEDRANGRGRRRSGRRRRHSARRRRATCGPPHARRARSCTTTLGSNVAGRYQASFGDITAAFEPTTRSSSARRSACSGDRRLHGAAGQRRRGRRRHRPV